MGTHRGLLIRAAAAATSVVLIGACSSTHEIDREAWKKDLAALGTTVSDWAKYEKTTMDLCAEDDPSMFLAIAKDNGMSMKVIETNYRNACPGRLSVFEDALAKMGQTSGEVDQACQTAKSERTERQQVLAEAIGC